MFNNKSHVSSQNISNKSIELDKKNLTKKFSNPSEFAHGYAISEYNLK